MYLPRRLRAGDRSLFPLLPSAAVTRRGRWSALRGAALLLLTFLAAPVARGDVYWVNTTADGHDANPGDGICATESGCCTFRAAVEEANATTNEYPADTVSLPIGLYRLTLGRVEIRDGMTIRGDGSCRTVIDGNDASGILLVEEEVDEMVNLRDLTLQNGNADTGGALWVQSEDSFIQCFDVVFRNNFGYSWGGAIKTRSSLHLNDCTVDNNETYARGGGIDASASAYVKLQRTTISNNKANQGGGIRVLGSLEATNSTFSQNHADFTGGAILNVGVTHLASCTVAFNTAFDVGGGVNNINANAIQIWNTIVAENQANNDGSDIYGKVKWEVQNLLGTGDGATVTDAWANAMIGDDSSPLDARLDPTLQFNGGRTRTHALLWNSPAIDSGSSATPGGGSLFACQADDQRKFGRAVDGDSDGDAVCDLGAYEFNAAPPADGDEDDKECLTGYYGGGQFVQAEQLQGRVSKTRFVHKTPVLVPLDTIEREGCSPVFVQLDPKLLTLTKRFATPAAALEATGSIVSPARFLRGDADGDGALAFADVLRILAWQFAGGDAPGCLDAADADDDGTLGVGDPFAILDRLFVGGAPLPLPGSERCGADPTRDGLDCDVFTTSCVE